MKSYKKAIKEQREKRNVLEQIAHENGRKLRFFPAYNDDIISRRFRFLGKVKSLAQWIAEKEISEIEIKLQDIKSLNVGDSIALTRHTKAYQFTRVK